MMRGWPNVMVICLCVALLSACSSAPTSRSARAPAPVDATWPDPVAETALKRAGTSAKQPLLDVAVLVFDTGLDTVRQDDVDAVFAEVRKAESLFIPVQLRRALEESGHWGVVRVVPERPDSAALIVSGKILHADGRDLVLSVMATDAAGREWLSRTYRGRTTADDYPVADGRDPFASVYHQIANDLHAVRSGSDAAAVAALPDIALMRFAERLAPAVFSDYLERNASGRVALTGFPAEGDTMLQRVRRLQRQENLFIDTVDEQYRVLVEDFAPTYHLWREYSRELVVYEEDYVARQSQREIQSRRGTFSAMQQTYNTFRRAKVHEQDLYELATGFDNEVTATVVDVDDRIFRLQGSLREQFVEWRSLLERIFALEAGPTS
ncbi:hypothetical protein [Chromatocurvus halotolerans]|uniref:Uncharacterized protein n=1 Tax=Chromatocurvus halotolerans TaxID=1132028 RepID=A0A4R2KNC6_9GAMM|nr:hypothetical protein [Chromatocurvus halotolerans]TCO75661.1 hypothetical protein EV688_10779 [Chromatocurvus halotolerans]